MTDVHAAIGRAQLAKLPGWTQQRQQNAKFLDANLCGVVIPPVADGAVHVYHQYTIRIPDDRDGFARALADEHGIGSGVYYPIPNHRLPSFGRTLDLPETERAAREVLSLPVHPALSADDLAAIATAVNAVAAALQTQELEATGHKSRFADFIAVPVRALAGTVPQERSHRDSHTPSACRGPRWLGDPPRLVRRA